MDTHTHATAGIPPNRRQRNQRQQSAKDDGVDNADRSRPGGPGVHAYPVRLRDEEHWRPRAGDPHALHSALLQGHHQGGAQGG